MFDGTVKYIKSEMSFEAPLGWCRLRTFEDKLCKPVKQEFDEYLSKESDVSAYHTGQAFVVGFKVGAQMMLEILEVGKND